MNILNLLQGQLPDNLVDQLTQQIGAQNRQQTVTAAGGIVTALIGAMARNASSSEGAAALSNALDRDHDGGILQNITSVLAGNAQAPNQRAVNGAGILSHILGEQQGGIADMVSKMSGLNTNQTGQLMTMLAPVVMGVLGKTKRDSGLDVAGIASLLNNTVATQKNSNPTMSLITSFLDKNNDGSIVDDVARLGMKFLGGLFGKK